MKKEEKKPFIQCCILGAIGGILMAAGDWLLGCIPLQQTDTGLFNRAYYLSGSYGLWKPVLTVGLGAVGGFLYYFVVKALNADIDTKYRKTKIIQYLCGIFTVAVALTIHTWVATMAWFTTDDTGFRHPFRDAACGQDTVFPVDAGFSPGHMESSAGCCS